MMGIGKPTLYCDYECTLEVEKIDGIYTIGNLLMSDKVSDTDIHLFVKNEGDRNCYNVRLKSFIGDIVSSTEIEILKPNQSSMMSFALGNGEHFPTNKKIWVVIEYDNM